MKKQYHDFLNIIGLRCPEPLMIIRRKIRNMKKNDKILILSDDPTTKRDVPKFCFFMDYTLISQDIYIKPYRYVIKK